MSGLKFGWTGAMSFRLSLCAMLCAALPGLALAAELSVLVRNSDGEPIEGAVLMATAPGVSVNAPDTPVLIDQVDKEFAPFLTVVPAGTRIAFPNSDNIRHHVYSFSEAKRFEIPLYGGDGTAPEIVVDQAGVIALGCNVHDWMRAYVVVTDTPYTGQTGAEGRIELVLPTGEYSLRVWHPGLRDAIQDEATAVTLDAEDVALELTVPDQPRWRAWWSPDVFGEDY